MLISYFNKKFSDYKFLQNKSWNDALVRSDKHYLAQLDDFRAELNTLKSELKTNQKFIDGQLENTVEKNFEFTDNLTNLRRDLDGTIQKLVDLAAKVESRNENLTYQNFHRDLPKDWHLKFNSSWGRKLGLTLSKTELAYMGNRVCELEKRSRGRLASNLVDALLRILVSKSVQKEKIKVLEIGVLFGLGLISIHDQLRHYKSVHLTGLDPLEGYYGNKNLDKLTSEFVTEEVLLENLSVANVPSNDVKIIKNLSTDDAAIKTAMESKYDVLIIDGDHSLAGVKADYVNYMTLVNRGGYIVFDDYGAKDWPDIQEFVDQIVMNDERVALIGVESRTAVFRVTSSS